MKTSSSLRWVGWSLAASGVCMVTSIVINIVVLANGTLVLGTHTHSALMETFDALTITFLLPVPYAYHRIYRRHAPGPSLFAMLTGTISFSAALLLNILFIFEILWFSDSLGYYGVIVIGYILWLVLCAYLAYRSRRPAHGVLLNLTGATVVGFPIWLIWLARLFLSGKLTVEAVEAAQGQPA